MINTTRGMRKTTVFKNIMDLETSLDEVIARLEKLRDENKGKFISLMIEPGLVEGYYSVEAIIEPKKPIAGKDNWKGGANET